VLPVWGGVGLIIYFLYSRKNSHVGRGHVEVHEDDADAPHNSEPPVPEL
jgi:APA family basic amino acid/polyamine antiporter